jgi:hypothetical protein
MSFPAPTADTARRTSTRSPSRYVAVPAAGEAAVPSGFRSADRPHFRRPEREHREQQRAPCVATEGFHPGGAARKVGRGELMPRIEGYRFGHVVVDGEEQTRDVIVLPDRVLWVPESRFASILTGAGLEDRLFRIRFAPGRSTEPRLATARSASGTRRADRRAAGSKIVMGRYAASSYSWRRPPSRSRRRTRHSCAVAGMGAVLARGGCCPSERCGRCVL